MDDTALAALALALADADDARAVGVLLAERLSARAWLLGLVSGEKLEPLAAGPDAPGQVVAYRAPQIEGPLENPAEVSPRLEELANRTEEPLQWRALPQRAGDQAIFVADRELPERALPLVAAALDRVRALDADPSLFRDRALSTISHDLRGPLNVIGFAGSMLRSSVGEEDQDLVAKIRRAARQMEGMIRDLLDLGELEAGRLELHSAETNLRTVIGHVEAAARPTAEEAKVDFGIEVAAPEGALHCDASQLARAIALLIDGACRFAKKGTVTLRASVEEDGGAWLEVEDSGTPLDDETRSKLFRPQQRGEEPHPRAKGLRLTLARRLVEAHGGRLEALESSGVRIRATLPAAPAS